MKSKDQGLGIRGWGIGVGYWRLLNLLLAMVAASPGLAGGETRQPDETDLRVTVRVYNYARVSPADMATAERVAARIFRQTGVELSWVDCPRTRQEAQQNPACQSSHTPTEILLRVVSEFPEGLRLPPSSMGFALGTLSPQGGYLAGISYARAQKQLPEATGLTLGQLLGHGIAHEIGHLLLGMESHSPSGLMGAHWKAQELMLAAYGQFNFSHSQAEAIRADVRARMQMAEAARQPQVATLE